MIKNFYFTQSDIKNWVDIKEKVILEITLWTALAAEKKAEFQVSLTKLSEKKSNAQLRGFHRLLDYMLPHLKEISGEHWSRDRIKELIKKRNYFTENFRGIELLKSCQNASKEEMMGLIKECEIFAAEIGIEGCYLQDQEKKELEDYYQNLPLTPKHTNINISEG